MANKTCPECGYPLQGNESACPECGFPLTPARNNSNTHAANNGARFERSYSVDKFAIINAFILRNRQLFPEERFGEIISTLEQLSPEEIKALNDLSYIKYPALVFIASWVLGFTGLDRALTGRILSGIFKMLLCLIVIGFIWWIIDTFFILAKVKEYNYNLFIACAQGKKYSIVLNSIKD